MSSSGKGARVSIPENVKKMIQNIRDITDAPEDEIYATLKECSMDPNETAQKLLSQDRFHEVKSKRDKRRENMSNKEPVDSKLKPGQGRGGRGGRGNYSSRYISNVAASGRNALTGKENTSNQSSENSTGLPFSSSSQEPKHNEPAAAARTAPVIANGPSAIVAKGMKAHISKSEGPASHENINFVKENLRENSGMRKVHRQLTSSSSDSSAAESQVTSPGVHFSSSDPVLVPSNDSRIPGAVGTIKREVRCQPNPTEQASPFPSEGKTIAETSEVGKNQSDTTVRPSSAHSGSSVVRPSSNHSSRSQQIVGPSKGSSKEWKPKSTNATIVQGSPITSQSEVSAAVKVSTQSRPVTHDLDSKDTSTKLERKMEELHILNNHHVIIPNHLHVPGAEKISFCFGSFDAISIDTSFKNAPHDSNPAPPLETNQSVEETAEETSSLQNVLAATEEGAHHDYSQIPENATETLPAGGHDVPSAGSQEYDESKPESDLAQGTHQIPTIHTPPGYGFGLMPTMMGSQLPPFEGSQSQGHEISNVPNFLQAFDPASYYTQIYRPAAEGDGRISPFHAGEVATRYNGGVAVLPTQTSSSVPEGGNSLAMSTAGLNAFVTQPINGLMPNSIAMTQQPVPVFRHPFGIPIPQYPLNYMPYPYFPPYFFPPFNHSMSNSVYPQQPQSGGIYPGPPGQSLKFSLPQYKPGTSSGNSTTMGVASSYGPSGSATGNSTPSEDLTAQQFKENNAYISGQQLSEGPVAWFTPPSRDMPGVPATSFYNIPSQGQVAFPQSQPGHGPFTGIYAVSPSPGHQLLQQSQAMASNVDGGPPQSWPNNNY